MPRRCRPKPPPESAWSGKPRVRVLSTGGGLDSWGMLLAQLERGELPDLVVFADVTDRAGVDPGEWPGTYEHLREDVEPLCLREGIEFLWIDTETAPIRGERSLYRYFLEKKLMPGRQSRLCTAAAKVERITDALIARYPDRPVEVWIGFEAGEEKRAARDPHAAGVLGAGGWRLNRFPLIELGLCRCRCEELVVRLGYKVPRKSACVFCPFSSRGDFQTLAEELPDRFAQTELLEDDCRTTKSGKIMRYGYQLGDGTDPALAAWVAKPYRAASIACHVCGRALRASKATGCGSLGEDERVAPLLLTAAG